MTVKLPANVALAPSANPRATIADNDITATVATKPVVNVTLTEHEAISVTVSPTPPAAVTVIAGGPRGPQGIPGPSGAASASQVFTFVNAATWTCPHDLGRLPVSILVLDATGMVRPFAQVTNPDLNTTVVNFNPPLSGTVTIQ